ncbi:MAG: Rho termination factor N-terminal domain-containing protein [Bacilli bacterium]
MEKALETVKKKEDRPRRFEERKPFDKNRPYNNNRKDFRKPYERFNNNEPVKPLIGKVAVKEEKIIVKEIKKEESVIKDVVKEEIVTINNITNDLTNLTVVELREMAKNKEIKGFSTMKKAELIEALK